MLGADSLRARMPAAIDDEASDTAGDAEAALVARAKADRSAFVPLYQRYLDPVYRYCYGCLGSREAAEDATSLVFAKALDALPQCREASFRSWLFAIAHNVVADARRRSRPAAPLDEAGAVPDRSPAASPENAALAANGDRAVLALLARLPDDQRQIVELRLAGLTGPEIARALRRSHGAVRVAQFRAYSRLRDLVTEREREDTSDDRA